jgi:ABC-type uncharacterized transport system fused permease/ATPase subunit
MLKDYMADRTYCNMHSARSWTTPDQRLTVDIKDFTATYLGLTSPFLHRGPCRSFSGMLFSIYPPLFGIAYRLHGWNDRVVYRKGAHQYPPVTAHVVTRCALRSR